MKLFWASNSTKSTKKGTTKNLTKWHLWQESTNTPNHYVTKLSNHAFSRELCVSLKLTTPCCCCFTLLCCAFGWCVLMLCWHVLTGIALLTTNGKNDGRCYRDDICISNGGSCFHNVLLRHQYQRARGGGIFWWNVLFGLVGKWFVILCYWVLKHWNNIMKSNSINTSNIEYLFKFTYTTFSFNYRS